MLAETFNIYSKRCSCVYALFIYMYMNVYAETSCVYAYVNVRM